MIDLKLPFLAALAAVTLLSSACNRTVDAGRYGFEPGADPATNTAALQKALDGGRKTVTVTKPGIYDLDGTIYIDDNTTLEFAGGVVLRKAAPYAQVLVNRGAPEREYNTGITIKGLTISVNGFDNPPDEKSALFGLRAQLSFLCAHNVEVYDFKLEDLGKMQYAIQFNQCDHYVLDGFVIKGDKDGVHISSSDSFVVRNGVCRTFDDALALNASDWISSNCVDGDITNGLIENVTDEYLQPTSGVMCRLLLGAWVDWHPGISIKRSDLVVHDGRMYKAITPVKDTVFYSETAPTIDTFEGFQKDASGFKWKLMRRDSVYYSTNIRNVVFRDIKSQSTRCSFSEQVFLDDCEWARSLHPEVRLEDYPEMSGVVVEDSDLSGTNWIFGKSSAANTQFTFKGIKGYRFPVEIWDNQNPALRNDISFIGCDFTSHSGTPDFVIRNNVNLNISGCKFNTDTITVKSAGKVTADMPVKLIE